MKPIRRFLLLALLTLIFTLLGVERRRASAGLQVEIERRRHAIAQLTVEKHPENVPSPPPPSPPVRVVEPPLAAATATAPASRPAPVFFEVPVSRLPVLAGYLGLAPEGRVLLRWEDGAQRWLSEGEGFRGWQLVHLNCAELILYTTTPLGSMHCRLGDFTR